MTWRTRFSLSAYLRDDRAVAAIEFALIFPLMAAILLGSVETSQVLEAKRKETNVASTVADLVAQEKSVDNADITNIFQGATMLLSPFDTSTLQVVVTSVINDSDGNPVVDWSDGYNATARTPGANMPADFPDDVVVTGSSVIVAEVTYSYTSPYGWNITGPITMRDTYYCRPRRSTTVVRNNF